MPGSLTHRPRPGPVGFPTLGPAPRYGLAVRRYGSEDNDRWAGFVHRPGDIVVSTRSKCGTTWMQMICALLVFGEPELPAPLAEISPWLDWGVEPVEVVRTRLEAQEHRRIIKTHTPLDGLPLDPRVTYVVVGRHPLDVAVSLHHHHANIDRARMDALQGRSTATQPPLPLDDWLRHWIAATERPEDQLDSLQGLLHHVTDAWDRGPDPAVVLVHYQDLVDDLDGQMRALAGRLDITVPGAAWPALVEAASFTAMRARATTRVPDHLGVLRDARAFFRSGRSGEGRARLGPDDLERYHRRAAELAPPDVLAWLHR